MAIAFTIIKIIKKKFGCLKYIQYICELKTIKEKNIRMK
jgi:hypothetical protein